jgi:hypothetical protein
MVEDDRREAGVDVISQGVARETVKGIEIAVARPD